MAKIALISAERTPLRILLINKKKNRNGAVTVIRRRASVKLGASKHEMFQCRSADFSECDNEEDDTDGNDHDADYTNAHSSRRISLSMILGVAPGCPPAQRYDSKTLERENSDRLLTEDEIAELRREFFCLDGPAATDFRTIPRHSIAGYRSLEVLLKPFYKEPIGDVDALFTNPPLEGDERAKALVVSTELDAATTAVAEATSAGYYSPLGSASVQVLTDVGEVVDGSPGPTAIDGGEFIEIEGTDQRTKFRFNKQGDVYMSDSKGKFTRCGKNMSMYYDMLTEEETMTKLSHLTDDVHEMTGNDMFKAQQPNEDVVKSKCAPGQSVEEYLELEKRRRMKENYDFVETIARISKLQLEGAPQDTVSVLQMGMLNKSSLTRQESSFSEIPDFTTPPPELEDAI